MALNKAIESGKEFRKAYIGGKAISKHCRNHGGCTWCLGNRLYKFEKVNEKTLDMLAELGYNVNRKRGKQI